MNPETAIVVFGTHTTVKPSRRPRGETFELIPNAQFTADLRMAIAALPRSKRPCCMTLDMAVEQAIDVGTWEFSRNGIKVWLDQDGQYKVEMPSRD